MRTTVTAFVALSALLLAGPAFSEDKPISAPASNVMPPVELAISLKDGKPVCAPAELRLPADTNVSINIVSTANAPITITAAGQFENGHVLHADGDLIHAASEKAYTIKQNGKGTLKLRTMKAGETAYGCASNRNANDPFVGKLILTPQAG